MQFKKYFISLHQIKTKRMNITNSLGIPLKIGSIVEIPMYNGEHYIGTYKVIIDTFDNQPVLAPISGNTKFRSITGYRAFDLVGGKMRKGVVKNV